MLQGAQNFRPIAGVKEGTVYRSNELSKLTDQDLEELKKLKIRTIIDFRTPNERKSHLDRITADLGIQQINIPIPQLSHDINAWELMGFLFKNASTIDFEKYVHDIYPMIAYERTNQIRKILSLIAEPTNLPLVIHCTLGKDRTGLIAALLQSLVKTPHENILKDYLLTNELLKNKVRNYMFYLRLVSLFRISTKRLTPLFQVKAEDLDSILKDVQKKYGNVEEYLMKVCQLKPEEIAQLKSQLAP